MIYATLPLSEAAFNALQDDFSNNSSDFFFCNYCMKSQVFQSEIEGNTSKAISPTANVNYFIKFTEGLEGLQSPNVEGYAVIEDLETWKQTNTLV